MAKLPPYRTTRPVNWLKAALRDFQAFPERAREAAADALTIVADGGRPDIAKPLTGLGAGVWELAIHSHGEAWRVVYVLKVEEAVWVIHAFHKKSKKGAATPKAEIDLVRERLKRLKEQLG